LQPALAINFQQKGLLSIVQKDVLNRRSVNANADFRTAALFVGHPPGMSRYKFPTHN
jgi:hypothetical protein